MDKRLHFLDNLRTFIILLVVLFHTAYAYSVYYSQGFYVPTKQNSLFFDILIINAEVFMMPVMFFIAGYFGISSLARKGQAAFWKDKLNRVMLPWVLGVIFLAPVMGYMHLLSRGQAPSYLHYWAGYFFSKDYQDTGQAQFYFLGILFLFYVILSIAYRLYKPLGNVSSKAQGFSDRFALLFGAAVGIAIFCSNLVFDDSKWRTMLWIFQLPPTRFLPYLLYFFLGVYAYRQQWFASPVYAPKPMLWKLLCVTSFSLFDQTIGIFNSNKNLLSTAGYSLFRAFFCLSLLVILLDIFRKHFNHTTPLLGKLAANSYGIYFVHFVIVVFMVLAFREVSLNVFTKYSLAGTLSIAISYIVSLFVLSKTPVFGGTVGNIRAGS